MNCNITYFISLHVELFFWTWCIILIRALQAIECKAAHLKEKQCLDSLYLNWIGEDIDEASVSCDEMSLEVLQPYINLKALRLNCYGEWDFHFGLCCSKILSNLNHIYVKIANLPSIAASSSSPSSSSFTIVAPLSKLSYMCIQKWKKLCQRSTFEISFLSVLYI